MDTARRVLAEFAGLPGSGKTTIARQLAAADPRLRAVALKPSLDPLFRQPSLALAAVRWGLLRPGLAWSAWAKLCLMQEQAASLEPNADEWLLLEEGLAHHVWRSLYRYSAVRACPWMQLVETGPPLVVLRASRATRHARLPGKEVAGDTNRRLAAGRPDEATWGEAERLFEEVIAVAGRRRRVIEVSTEGDVAAGLARVTDVIGSLR